MAGLDGAQVRKIKQQIVEMVEEKARFVLTSEERANVLVVSFGDFHALGVAAVDTILAPRYGARLIIFLPNQVMPEHWHPDAEGIPGKEETFRVLWGEVRIFGPGEPTPGVERWIPAGKADVFTSRHEVHLRAGEQATASLHDRHWLVAGPEGVVGLEVSSTVRDEHDLMTDPSLVGVRL
jgi:D-lyxose ketol-isomerase